MKRFIWMVAATALLASGCDGYLSVQGEAESSRDERAGPGAERRSGGQTDTPATAEPDDTRRPNPDETCGGDGPRDPGPALVRRLTVDEYVETVRHAVGVDIGSRAREVLPAEVRADGFRNTAYSLTVDLGHIEGYDQLAGEIVERLDVPDYVSSYVDCTSLEEACFRDLVGEVGPWLLRGPIGATEREAFLDVYRAVAEADGDFEEAASYVLEAMLQSPRFIYRIENQQLEGSVERDGDFELASRLSYFVWGGPPDRELMEAAEAGEVSGPKQVTDQVDRMLDDPRADKSLRRFIYDWLSLGRLQSLDPDAERFPGWSAELAADMRDETLAFAEYVARDQKRPLSDLFDAQTTFATARLAEHYDLESKGEGMQRYDVSDVPGRGGILTHGAVATIGGDEASTVSRGLFILRDVLCGDVSSPPPDVDTTPVPAKPGQSQREIAEGRVADPQCGGCHSKFEPLAFGLGKFDGVGKYVETDEHGNRLRDDGEMSFPGKSEPVTYENASEMMELLAGSDRVDRCLTRKVTQFAVGRKLTEDDACALREIRRRFREGGETYASLVAAIATSDLFTLKRDERGNP